MSKQLSLSAHASALAFVLLALAGAMGEFSEPSSDISSEGSTAFAISAMAD